MPKDISAAGGVFGYTALVDKLPQEVREFAATTTIAAKQVVSLNATGFVTPALTDAPIPAFGVALESGVANDVIKVVVGGAALVNVNGTVTALSAVKPSATTAGRVAQSNTPGVGESLGFALDGTTDTTGSCTIFIVKSI